MKMERMIYLVGGNKNPAVYIGGRERKSLILSFLLLQREKTPEEAGRDVKKFSTFKIEFLEEQEV